MTRAETDLLLQLSKDTNERITSLGDKFEQHADDDNKRFEGISKGIERQDTRWKIIQWGFWPFLALILGFVGYKI